MSVLRVSPGVATMTRQPRRVASGPVQGTSAMKRSVALVIGASLILFGASVPVAAAQEPPVCGPPGGEVPATIVGAGTINGTPGNDVIVGSPEADRISGAGGNDIICGEGGNDVVNGGPGDDVLIGDELDSTPFAPSNGNNDDELI